MENDDLGTMSQFEAEAHSFIVRLWREKVSASTDAEGWRGRLEHVQSGRHQYFSNLEEVPDILRSQAAEVESQQDVFEPQRRKRS